MNPRLGEVYWVDLGMKAKVRPLLVVSREDKDAARALCVCVPLTTSIRGGAYEVPLPKVRWMQGENDGVANVQGIMSVEHHRLGACAGRFDKALVKAVKKALAWMLELENPTGQKDA